MGDCAFIIPAKYPRPQYSKTRLIPDIGDVAASRLSECFLVDSVRRFTEESKLRVVIVGSDIDTEEEFSDLLGRHHLLQDRVEILIPKCGSMIDDMIFAYENILSLCERAVMSASDIPYLSVRMVERIIGYLDHYDLVFHPNVDNVATPHGMKRPLDIFRGTPSTLLELWYARIKELGIFYKILEPLFDIDRMGDLIAFYHWQLFLEDSGDVECLCPETMHFLKSFMD